MLELRTKEMLEQVQVEITPADQESAWQETEKFSNPITRYSAYLNCVGLKAFLRWLQGWLEEEKTGVNVQIWPRNESLMTVWEFVTGTALDVGNMRLILIPSDDFETGELRVPQEWVDNPKWIGDYYLAVRINLDGDDEDCWLQVGGFTTHRKLKNDGVYNPFDRSYRLGKEELIKDLMVMELIAGLDVREEVMELEVLSEGEAEVLLNKLGDSAIYSPRLLAEVAVEKWLALISNEKWRKKLYEKRLGIEEVKKPAVNLRRWLEGVFEAGWQSVEEVYYSTLQGITAKKVYAANWRSEVMLPVVLVMTVTPNTASKTAICLQVKPASGEICLQPNLKVTLQNEKGEKMREKQAGRDTTLIEINLMSDQPGDQFCVIIEAGDQSITENFKV